MYKTGREVPEMLIKKGKTLLIVTALVTVLITPSTLAFNYARYGGDGAQISSEDAESIAKKTLRKLQNPRFTNLDVYAEPWTPNYKHSGWVVHAHGDAKIWLDPNRCGQTRVKVKTWATIYINRRGEIKKLVWHYQIPTAVCIPGTATGMEYHGPTWQEWEKTVKRKRITHETVD